MQFRVTADLVYANSSMYVFNASSGRPRMQKSNFVLCLSALNPLQRAQARGQTRQTQKKVIGDRVGREEYGPVSLLFLLVDDLPERFQCLVRLILDQTLMSPPPPEIQNQSSKYLYQG